MPLCKFHNGKSVSILSAQHVQRIKTLTSSTFFTELCPFRHGNCVCSVTLEPSEIFSPTLVQIQSIIIGCAENKNHNSTCIFDGIMPLCKFHNGNSVSTITPKPFEIFSQNLVKHKALSDHVQRTRTITPSTFLLNYAPWKISSWKLCPLNNFETL